MYAINLKSTYLVTAKNHPTLLPQWIGRYLRLHKVPEGVLQTNHERRAGRDAIRIETCCIGQLFALLSSQIFLRLRFFGRTESAKSKRFETPP